jgi:Domain of unknown function (DUF4189)
MKKMIVTLIGSFGLMVTAAVGHATGSLVIDTHRAVVYGWAISYISPDVADAEALSRCGASCVVVLRFTHTCAAYAADLTPNSIANGWSESRNLSESESNAIFGCQARGGSNCIVLAWGCDS